MTTITFVPQHVTHLLHQHQHHHNTSTTRTTLFHASTPWRISSYRHHKLAIHSTLTPSDILMAPKPSKSTPTTSSTIIKTAIRQKPTQSAIRSPSSSPRQSEASQNHIFQFLTWPQVETLSSKLTNLIKTSNESFDLILAITRGGLVPATLLSQSFELRNIVSATVLFYTDDGEQFFGMTEPRFLSFPSVDNLKDRRVLIVDDVWDSGRTAYAVRNKVIRASPKSVKVAVLHYKSKQNIISDLTPDYYGEITDNWVVYPWESRSPSSPSCQQQVDVTTSTGNEDDDSNSNVGIDDHISPSSSSSSSAPSSSGDGKR